jgi:hypothetical protein
MYAHVEERSDLSLKAARAEGNNRTYQQGLVWNPNCPLEAPTAPSKPAQRGSELAGSMMFEWIGLKPQPTGCLLLGT